MPVHAGFGFDALTVVVYIAILWIPGGIAGALLGVRGWLLAASAPVITYFIGGTAGPLLSMVGLRYNWVSFAVFAVIVMLLCGAARWLTLRYRPPAQPSVPPGSDWLRSSHLVVAAVVLVAAVVGCYTVIKGMGWLDSIPQDWDAAFEANGIRYIAQTGDGSLVGMLNVNLYDPPNIGFYPNAYHLIAVLVYESTRASIPAVLNANTILVPGLLALSLVATVRAFRGRVSTACYTALIAVAGAAGVYENMVRGPLLPYGVSVVLIPVVLIALHRYLDRPAVDTGALVVITSVGLLLEHPSSLFGTAVLGLPMLVMRWWVHRAQLGRELLRLVAVVACAAIVGSFALLAAVHGAAGGAPVVWPVQMTPSQAVGTLLTFEHIEAYPQAVLAIALWIGLARARKLAGLRWVLGSAAFAGLIFVAVAAYNNSLVISLSRAWWDDRYRLIVLAFVPLVVIAAHGMTQTQDWLVGVAQRLPGQFSQRALAGSAAVVLLAAFLVLSKGLYQRSDEAIVQGGYGTAPGVNPHDMVVSPDEVLAMQKLGTLVKPGDRVMNDRYDGSVWMYAIAGVQAVAGHYDPGEVSPEVLKLGNDFNQYDTNASVRAAVAKFHITYAIVDTGFVRAGLTRQPGLTNLDHCDFLVRVYSNPDATIYRLVPPGQGQ